VSAHDQPDLDPVLADAVRRAYVRPVDEITARRHVSAIAAAAAVTGVEPVTRRPRRRVLHSALAAGATALLLPVGLAVAGVTLPSALREPFRAVGITLPNQTSDAQSAPAPATRRVTSRSATTTPRPADRRGRPARAAHGQRQSGKRPVKPVKPAVAHGHPGVSNGPPAQVPGHGVTPAHKHAAPKARHVSRRGGVRPRGSGHKKTSPAKRVAPKQTRESRQRQETQ
jgi:hypothetical protein